MVIIDDMYSTAGICMCDAVLFSLPMDAISSIYLIYNLVIYLIMS